ncbi:MAG: DNA polymerase III subunit beta [Alphaproteobacteria bacterium]|nr:DNA polymerase III subunit beta [Alphaproteobacteria bacterium]
MKFIIERATLLKTLSHVQSIVEKRNTIPVLSNVKIEALADGISFKATDMDTEITEIVDAKIQEQGATTAPAHMLYDIVRKLSDGSEIELTFPDDKGQLTISSGKSKFSLSCIGVEDFPVISGDALPINFIMTVNELKSVIDRTKFAVSTEETRYYLNGIYMHAKTTGATSVLRIVATDGHRLACVESPLPQGAENLNGVIIPRKTIAEIRKLLDDTSVEEAKISMSDNKVRFTLEDVTLTSKLIDGTYPDYERVIPTDNDKSLEVSVKDLATAVDRVSVVAERTRAIKMITGNNHVIITTSSPELGSAQEELDASYAGEVLEIGYNFRYLLDILAEITGEKVKISFADASSPSVIHDISDSSAVFVLMPMRV